MASESKVKDISSSIGDTTFNVGSTPTPLGGPNTIPNVSQAIPLGAYSMIPIEVQIARAQAEVARLQEIKNLSQSGITVATGSGAPAFRKLEFTPNPNYAGRMANTVEAGDHDRLIVNDFRPKPPDPKVYKGEVRVLSDPNKEEQTIDEWIEYMDRYMYMTSMNEKFKVTFALMYLKGAPYSYMMMLLNPRGYRDAAPGITVSLPRAEDGRVENINDYTWEWMKQKLVANFRPFNQQQLLRDQIKTLKQGDKEDVMTYVQSFNRIASQIQEMTSAEELSYFRAGLKPYHLARIDSAEGAMTLSRAITLAAQQEASYNLQLTRKQNNSNSNNSKNSHNSNNNKGKQGPNGKNNYYNNFFSKKNNNPNYSHNNKPPSNNQQDKSSSAPTANVTVQNNANSSLNNIYSNSEYSSELEEEGEGQEMGEGDDPNYLANMNNSNSRPTGPWRCHKCNKTGHFIRDCPEMRNNNNQNHQNKRNGQSGKGGAH